MGKLIKYLVILLIIVLLAIAGIALSLDTILKTAVNNYVPKITQTAVVLEDVDFDIFKGSFKIEGLEIKNPSGFSDNNIFSLDKVLVKVDLSTLNSPVIVIDEISVEDANLLYEAKNGKVNLFVLMDNINSYIGESAEKPKDTASEKEEAGKKVHIKKLSFTDGKIAVDSTLTKKVEVNIPNVVVYDIGSSDKGIGYEEAIAKTFAAFTDSAIKAVSTSGAKKLLSDPNGLTKTFDSLKKIFD